MQHASNRVLLLYFLFFVFNLFMSASFTEPPFFLTNKQVDAFEVHPSIVAWVPFNEAWGQHRTVEVATWLTKRDPSRLVNAASGGNFWPVSLPCDGGAYRDIGREREAPRFCY